MPCVFFAGMELRRKPHQQWLINTLQEHIQKTAFPGFMFILHGCRFAWMKLEGRNPVGRFARIKEGAAARFVFPSPSLFTSKLSLLPLSRTNSSEPLKKLTIAPLHI